MTAHNHDPAAALKWAGEECDDQLPNHWRAAYDEIMRLRDEVEELRGHLMAAQANMHAVRLAMSSNAYVHRAAMSDD